MQEWDDGKPRRSQGKASSQGPSNLQGKRPRQSSKVKAKLQAPRPRWRWRPKVSKAKPKLQAPGSKAKGQASPKPKRQGEGEGSQNNRSGKGSYGLVRVILVYKSGLKIFISPLWAKLAYLTRLLINIGKNRTNIWFAKKKCHHHFYEAFGASAFYKLECQLKLTF